MEETGGKYDSIQQMMDSMPCELEVKTWESGDIEYYLLQSKNNDELQRHLPPDPSTPITRIPTGITLLEFCFFISRLHMISHLAQIWAPVSIGDKKYLTTSDQPFVMKELDRELCEYRKHCLNHLIPIDDDMISSEGGLLLGPPGRVFRNGLPELCIDIRHYTPIEYPLQDKALDCGIHSYLAFPLSKYSEYRYGSVAEVVVLKGNVFGFCEIPKRILDGNPEFIAGSRGPKNFNIQDMLGAICKAHDLLLAQVWFSASKHNNEAVSTLSSYISSNTIPNDLICFKQASSYIKKGRGVVGKAFSSKGACFCKDVTQLSIDEYSMLPNARLACLTGCFAISLTHRDQWRDYIFIFEFFLPRKKTENADPRTLIKNLVATMKEHLKDYRVASGQELGEPLFVEVIKTSPTDELDSFEIGAGVDGTLVLSGETQVALDHEIGANMFPGASNLNQHGGEVMVVDAKTEADQRDINSEILKNQRAKKRIQRDYGITRAKLLQHSWEKQEEAAAHLGVSRSTFKRICREYQIFRWPPRREKHPDGPSNGAQGPVQSENEIMKDSVVEQLPWPVHPLVQYLKSVEHLPRPVHPFEQDLKSVEQLPRPVHPFEQDLKSVEQLPQPVQPVEQGLNSKPDSSQNAVAVENDSNIAVKVTYRNSTIKFYLTVSSGKMALEEEIAKRLRLSIGSFEIRYLDEDGDWISVTCDADLNVCISIMRSLGKNIKMSVHLSQDG